MSIPNVVFTFFKAAVKKHEFCQQMLEHEINLHIGICLSSARDRDGGRTSRKFGESAHHSTATGDSTDVCHNVTQPAAQSTAQPNNLNNSQIGDTLSD